MSLEKILASEFIKLLNASDKYAYIKDKQIINHFRLTKEDFNNKEIFLDNCIFDEVATFEGIDFDFGIRLVNCEFKKSLNFINNSTTHFNSEFDFDGDALFIRNCKINKLIIISQNSFNGNIRITDKTVIGELNINNVELTHENAQFIIKDSFVNNNFNFSNNTILNKLNIERSIFEGEIVILRNKLNDFQISDTEFKKIVILRNNIVNDTVWFNKCDFKDEMSSTLLDSKMLTLKDSKFHNSCDFKYFDLDNTSIIKKISIDSCSFSNGVKFWGSNNPIDPPQIEEIDINSSNKLIGKIHFFNFSVDNAYLTGANYNAHIIFDVIRFQNLNIENFTNYNNLQFISIKSTRIGESNLFIQNSLLGPAHFANCFLDSFTKVTILDSVLSEIITSNVKWFSPVIVDTSDNQRKRELFRQLKNAMEKQGDRIQALIFKQYEMSAFKMELFSESGRCGDKFILFLSQTNDFGQNWWKPLFYFLFPLTIAFGIILLLVLNIQIKDFSFTFCTYKKIFVNLLDPSHSLKNIFGEVHYISGYLYGIDIFYRVIYAYLVFQTISAFRKYLK